MTGPPRLFLDACVLYPPLLRRLLLGAAESGLLVPLWSARVLDEWAVSAARKLGPDAVAEADAARAAMAARFPDALCPPAPEAEAALAPALPDPADAHVLAAAEAAGADAIVTLNLRDFPARTLAARGLTARHPDGVLWEIWSHAPDPVAALAETAVPGEDAAARRRALKRARLPRLGKALASDGAVPDGTGP